MYFNGADRVLVEGIPADRHDHREDFAIRSSGGSGGGGGSRRLVVGSGRDVEASVSVVDTGFHRLTAADSKAVNWYIRCWDLQLLAAAAEAFDYRAREAQWEWVFGAFRGPGGEGTFCCWGSHCKGGEMEIEVEVWFGGA